MVSIIIVNYNQNFWLSRCLERIKSLASRISIEVIIIDNASKISVEPLIKEYEKCLNLRLIKNRINIGYARAVNQGIKGARGDYLLIINPDILITTGGLEKMVSFIKREKTTGILGPQLLNFDNTTQYSCFSFPYWFTPLVRRTFLGRFKFGKRELARYLMTDFDHNGIKEVDWVLGAAMMVRQEDIKKVGLLDEQFFLYFEDVDWCRRFKEAGFKVVYFPEAKFFHSYPRISAKSKGLGFLFNKFFWLHLISVIKYFKKWHSRKI